MKEVAVLLPFHRADNYLSQAIQSIKSNHSVRIQLILIDDRKEKVDDSFSDSSVEWTGGIGYGAALNCVRDKIECEFVALMNSDDLSSKNRLTTQIRYLEDTDTSISVSRLRKIVKGNIPLFAVGGNKRIVNPTQDFFLLGSHLANASWLMKSKVWVENVEFEKWSIGSDWQVGQTIIQTHKFHYINSPLYDYRSHVRQTTKSKDENFSEVVESIARLNHSLGYPPISKMLGLALVFPNFIERIDFRMGEIDLLNFQEWSRSIIESGSLDLIEIGMPRISYVNFKLWQSNPKSVSISPFVVELGKMFLKEVSNRSLTRILAVR